MVPERVSVRGLMDECGERKWSGRREKRAVRPGPPTPPPRRAYHSIQQLHRHIVALAHRPTPLTVPVAINQPKATMQGGQAPPEITQSMKERAV